MSKCDTINIRRNGGIRLYGYVYEIGVRGKWYLDGLDKLKTGILKRYLYSNYAVILYFYAESIVFYRASISCYCIFIQCTMYLFYI